MSKSIIGILEDPTKKFYTSFRFHPESLYTKDNNINNIFVEFINCCNKTKK